LRLAFALGAFALLVTGSLGVSQASVGHPTLARAGYAEMSASRTSPDIVQWMSEPIVVKRVHHAATIGRFAHTVLARAAFIAQRLTKSALRFIGVPYVFGGTTSAGFDCSGFVQHVFATIGVHLPRTADAQYDAGARVRNLRPGDLVFFETYTSGPSHVGIYLGHGRFVNASTSRGVTVSSLNDPYWANRYIGARNVITR
jgi:cell wall-associated NlpC family hydrolase